MQEFDRLAWESYKELAPETKDGPGKAIVYALTKHHAARLCYYLNQLHPEHERAICRSDYIRHPGRRRRNPPIQEGNLSDGCGEPWTC